MTEQEVTSPSPLDRLHALVDLLDDQPDLAERVIDISGLHNMACSVRVQLDCDAAPIAAWARVLGSLVEVRPMPSGGMHLSATGQLSDGVGVDVVTVLRGSPELAELGAVVTPGQLAPPMEGLDDATRAELAQDAETLARINAKAGAR